MKKRIVALVLTWFCGLIGLNNFYLNENKAGMIKLVQKI